MFATNFRMAIVVFLFGLQVLGLATNSYAQKKTHDKDGKDDVVGTRWKYYLTKEGENSSFEEGLFRVFDKEIFKGKTKVGTIKPQSHTETTLHINGLPEINGTAKLKKIQAKPAVWEGTLERKSGKHLKMRVEVFDQ